MHFNTLYHKTDRKTTLKDLQKSELSIVILPEGVFSSQLLVFNFYAMSLLLNVAIAIKNKNAVIEIPNMAVTKTLFTVKDVKDCSNRKLSGKSHFAKFTVLPIVDCNSSKNRPQKQTTMVIPADRSGLLTTSETEKAIALIRNSVYVPKTICKKQLVP